MAKTIIENIGTNLLPTAFKQIVNHFHKNDKESHIYAL